MKLHLGCGRNRFEGYVNCDVSPQVKPDKIVDLEKKLPFKTNSVEEIIIEHCLEHITNLYPLLEEFQRICRNNAVIKIRVPYFSSESAFSTMTHVRFFSLTTFDFLDAENSYHYDAPDVDMKTIRKKLKWRWLFFYMRILNKSQKLLRIYQEIFPYVIPAREIELWLKVRK